MDGFQVKKKFLCKELGMFPDSSKKARSFLFDLGIKFEDLEELERRNCRFVKRHIHKFGVFRGVKAYQITNLWNIVQDFHKSLRNGPSSTIAYKGEHF